MEEKGRLNNEAGWEGLTASSTIISTSISLSLLEDSAPSEGRPSFFLGVALEARATGTACSTTNDEEADEEEGTEGSAKANDDLGRAAGAAVVVGGVGATLGEVEKMLVADVAACSKELEAEEGMSKIVAGPLMGEGEVALVKMFRAGEEGAAAVDGAAEVFFGEGGSSGAVKMLASTW